AAAVTARVRIAWCSGACTCVFIMSPPSIIAKAITTGNGVCRRHVVRRAVFTRHATLVHRVTSWSKA
ncbi:hypothetical protein, partial [Robbsia andropogonis]|uniref:hypothetical protein n=1 Tax=Robbsia andropogonis TaxID=28092 RepID=UPI001C90B7D1